MRSDSVVGQMKLTWTTRGPKAEEGEGRFRRHSGTLFKKKLGSWDFVGFWMVLVGFWMGFGRVLFVWVRLQFEGL